MEQLLTVLVQTSPIPSHPSTALLEALVRSFQHCDGLLEARIIVVCDGCGEESLTERKEAEDNDSSTKENYKHGKTTTAETAARYRQHLQQLRHMVEQRQAPFVPQAHGSMELLELAERHGSARAIQAVFDQGLVQTPLVMICQHDNFFVRPFPLFRSCVHAMTNTLETGMNVKCLHFLSTSTLNYKEKVQKRYGVEIPTRSIQLPMIMDSENHKNDQAMTTTTTVTLVPLLFWYGRTHLSYTQHYQTQILDRNLKPGDHLEELLGVTQLRDIQQRGFDTAFPEYGTYVVEDGQPQEEVIYHLSGRRVRAAATTTTTAAEDNPSTIKPLQEEEEQITPIDSTSTTSTSAHDEISTTTSNQNFPDGGSFTTARSCRAIVPGLEIISEASSASSSTKTTTKQKQQQPKGRFKQKCFHCGIKGHSFKFCPNMIDQAPLQTETIDLS